jgi:NAD(P)-dependent dehydrogenase (short-subunit alcohol dehydrogenase family)
MSIYALMKSAGPSGFGYGSTAQEVVRDLNLSGRTIMITGCNSGIGLEAMRVLSSRGATVIGAARTVEKAQTACASVGASAMPVACELSDPQSVRDCVAEVRRMAKPLDVIICNAGIMALPKLELKHGYELQFFTNHMGHFLLVTGLLDCMSLSARMVVLSSDAHRAAPPDGIEFDRLNPQGDYSAWTAYGQSKLANLLFAKQLAKRFVGSGRVANAVHPGIVETKLARHMGLSVALGYKLVGPLFFKSIPQGAATSVWAAVHPDSAHLNGEYLANCNVARPSRFAQDARLAERLWAMSEQIRHELGNDGPAH